VENGVGLVRAFDRDADGVIVRRWGGSAPASFEVAGWSEEVRRPAKNDYTPQVSGAAGQLQLHLVEFDGTNIVSSRPLGAVVGFRRQGAYGQEFTSGGEPELRRSFHGHREEPGLRLTAAGPRHLLLADGRWLQPEPLLYLGIPEELRSDPRALMMYRYGHNAPSVYADRSGLNGEPQVEDGKIMRDAPPEEVEGQTWVVWPDEFAGTTFIEQVIRSTNVGGGPTSAAEKERRAAEVPVVQAAVKGAAAVAAVTAVVGAIRVVSEARDAAQAAARFGTSESTNYRKTFFAAHPELEGKVWVHHAVEQQVLTRNRGVVTESEIHSLENLRRIPNTVNSEIHLSKIRIMWNEFYRKHPTATKQQLLDHATHIDNTLGSGFTPPK
jgi:hypothetical protein